MKSHFKMAARLSAATLFVAASLAAQAQMTGPRTTTDNAPRSWIPYTSYGYVGANGA